MDSTTQGFEFTAKAPIVIDDEVRAKMPMTVTCAPAAASAAVSVSIDARGLAFLHATLFFAGPDGRSSEAYQADLASIAMRVRTAIEREFAAEEF